MYFSTLVVHLRELIADQALGFVFQPLFDLRRREVLGYEALLRGPEDSPLHTPEQLLLVAREAGLGLVLERLATRLALEAFVAAQLPGKAFLNLSAAMIVDQAPESGLGAMAEACGLARARLVVEHMHHREDGADGLDPALACLAAQGIGLSVDALDGGVPAGFVKLAPALIRNIHTDPARQRQLATLLQEAHALGTQVVAEGVEDARELAALCDLGCDCAQGYLLGRPAADPARQMSRGVAGILKARPVAGLRPGVGDHPATLMPRL